MLTINNTARAGALALIVACGAFAAAPSARATSLERVDFTFAYNASSLKTAEGRHKLDQRLNKAAAKHCRADFGARTNPASVRDCQRELVRAVKYGLVRGGSENERNCIAVSITPAAMRTDACETL